MKKIFNFRSVLAIVTVFLIIFSSGEAKAQKATWIWYPGDYDIWLSNNMQNRRTERGTFFPPFWRLYSPYNLVDFYKKCVTTADDELEIAAEGRYNVKIDGKMISGRPEKVFLPAGKHEIHLKVFNQATVPSIFVRGKQVVSDSTWLVTYEDKEWIDESGKASDISATEWLKVDFWNFNDPLSPPSAFRLATKPQTAQKTELIGKNQLVDFGKETFGYVKFHGLKGTGNLLIYYGESKEEALSTQYCETLDKIAVNNAAKKDLTLLTMPGKRGERRHAATGKSHIRIFIFETPF